MQPQVNDLEEELTPLSPDCSLSGSMDTWVYGGAFQPLNMGLCHPPTPKSNLSTSPAFLLTTTSAQGLTLIQQSISCVCIFKPLQNRAPHPQNPECQQEKGVCVELDGL